MNKKRIIVINAVILTVIGALVIGLVAGRNSESDEASVSWQEQYDLGVRYLSEGNYEEAIIAFTAAIEIDPKKPDTYEKLADVYITLGDIEKARDILEQGANATGEDDLRKRFEELQKNGVIVFSNNLNISNLHCYFVADQEIIEGNEGTIGGMNIDFIVDGPSDVRKVVLSTWYPNLPDPAEIADAISGTSDFWKNHQELAGEYKSLPFETSVTHMVWPEDIGETVYVVLVGLDENFDIVGYAVIQVYIEQEENSGNSNDNSLYSVKIGNLFETGLENPGFSIDDVTFYGESVFGLDILTMESILRSNGYEITTNNDLDDSDDDYYWFEGKSVPGTVASPSVSALQNEESVSIDLWEYTHRDFYTGDAIAVGFCDIATQDDISTVLSKLGFENSGEIVSALYELASVTYANPDDMYKDLDECTAVYNKGGNSYIIIALENGGTYVDYDNSEAVRWTGAHDANCDMGFYIHFQEETRGLYIHFGFAEGRLESVCATTYIPK